MKKKIKTNGVVLSIIVLFLAGMLWYYRPVSAFQLSSLHSEKDVKTVGVWIYHFGADGAEDGVRVFDIRADDPGMVKLLEQVNQVQFRRPPTNLIKRHLPNTVAGKASQPDSYLFLINMVGESSLELNFYIDKWSYSYPGSGMLLPCTVENASVTGNALGQFLWELAEKREP